jgi:hypothetical protein
VISSRHTVKPNRQTYGKPRPERAA